jgi:hypothetical protein
MIAARLRECLRVLRWDAADLADQLGYNENEIASWIEGRAVAPLAVAAWLEALVKAYGALPLPRRNQRASMSDVRPIRLPIVEIATRANRHQEQNGMTAQLYYPRGATSGSAAVRPGPRRIPSRGGSNHESRPL